MNELTFEEFCALPMLYTVGMTCDWGAHRLYRNEDHGLQKECVTNRNRYGDIYSGWQKQQTAYFLDGNVRQFKTLDQLYLAYMEKVCGIKGEA
jgi:hypothetical protein